VNAAAIEPFEATLSLDLFLLRGLRRELRAWLLRNRVADESQDEIVLATHEAAANAIEHAQIGSEVTIRGVREPSKVVIVVTNTGAWTQPRSLDETRGRGLVLMKQLMTDLEIQARSQRTVVRMWKDLAPSSAGA
jgi:serine/threonine-protein kinase RsbW